MSAIKKMNQELENILGREPTIHEQVDMLIFAVIKERLLELSVMYQLNQDDEIKEQYDHAVKCGREVQERNPDIFYRNDTDGGDDEDYQN